MLHIKQYTSIITHNKNDNRRLLPISQKKLNNNYLHLNQSQYLILINLRLIINLKLKLTP